MNVREWHWARLKKHIYVDDSELLKLLKSDPFIMPKNAIVWARTGVRRSDLAISISDAVLKENLAAFQVINSLDYSDLLEPLE